MIGITACPAAPFPDEEACRAWVAVWMMRLISGTQEPQRVPHWSLSCSTRRRSSLLARKPAPPGALAMSFKQLSISASVTLKQVHTGFPRDWSVTGALAPGSSRSRP